MVSDLMAHDESGFDKKDAFSGCTPFAHRRTFQKNMMKSTWTKNDFFMNTSAFLVPVYEKYHNSYLMIR